MDVAKVVWIGAHKADDTYIQHNYLKRFLNGPIFSMPNFL